MKKAYCCPNGHEWQSDSGEPRSEFCPVCGASGSNVRVGLNALGTGRLHLDTAVQESQFGESWDAPLRRFADYEIISELGRGGMGVVYKVFDHRRERLLALKSLPRITPSALQRFKREFRAIAGIVHPNVISIQELVSDGRDWFFTMELIDGVDFLTYVRWGHEPPPSLVDGEVTTAISVDDLHPPVVTSRQMARLRPALAQLAQGVACLHAHGLLHRDIKPSNVMVTTDGRVVLLDFGLAAELDHTGRHASSENTILGTVAYMAPEQAASQPTSQASDWYAVGTILYQILTGTLPFSGKPLEVLQQKQRSEPIAPKLLVPNTPDDLNDLCARLLKQVPAERPAREEILRVLQCDDMLTAAAEHFSGPHPTLVGRERHLAALLDAFATLKSGQPLSVFVHGNSGTGKSSLVQTFLDSLGRDQAVVLTGRCYEQESVPFKALDGLIDSLGGFLLRLPEREVEPLLPRDIHALVRVFPVLGQIEAVANAPRRAAEAPDEQEARRRAITALRELLARLSDRRPVLLFIDDLQWGDADSAALLADLLQPPDPPVVLFLGSYRSADADTSPFLQALRDIERRRPFSPDRREVQVAALTFEESVALVEQLLGQKRGASESSRESQVAGDGSTRLSHAEMIAREAGGNPFFLAELVRHSQSSWDDLPGAVSEGRLTLDDVLWLRACQLIEPARKLLETIAVAGQPIAPELAYRAAKVTGPGPTLATMLRAGHFVRTSGVGREALIEPWHDRVRESVVAHLEEEVRRGHHRALAETIEAAAGFDLAAVRAQVEAPAGHADRPTLAPRQLQVVHALAKHFDAAGDSAQALAYALTAAELARGQWALEVAEQLYRIAERGVGDGAAMRYRVFEGLGDVLLLRGKYVESAERLRLARACAETDLARAHVEGKLGEIAFKQGDMRVANAATETALRLLGRYVPKSAVTFVPLLAWEATRQVLHTYLPRRFVGRRPASAAETDLAVVRLLGRLSYGYWFARGAVPCLWAHLRSMNLAEQYGPTLELAHVYSTHAPAMSLIPAFGRGVRYASKSYDIRRDLGHLWGQGQSLHFWGVVLYAASRFEECIDRCREGVRLLEQTGDFWEVNIARYQIAASLYRLGRLQEAVDEAQRMHRSGVELGDAQASGISLDVWAWATGGDLTEERVHTEIERPRHDPQGTTQVLVAEGVRRLGAGDVAGAVETLERAHTVAENAQVRNAWVSPAPAWLATALRHLLQRTTDPRERRELLRRWKRAVSAGRGLAKKFRNDLPHVLRESALLAAHEGQPAVALRRFADSLAVAEQQGARFEQALTRLARGRAGERLGWSGSAEDVSWSEETLTALGGPFALGEFDEQGQAVRI